MLNFKLKKTTSLTALMIASISFMPVASAEHVKDKDGNTFGDTCKTLDDGRIWWAVGSPPKYDDSGIISQEDMNTYQFECVKGSLWQNTNPTGPTFEYQPTQATNLNRTINLNSITTTGQLPTNCPANTTALPNGTCLAGQAFTLPLIHTRTQMLPVTGIANTTRFTQKKQSA